MFQSAHGFESALYLYDSLHKLSMGRLAKKEAAARKGKTKKIKIAKNHCILNVKVVRPPFLMDPWESVKQF